MDHELRQIGLTTPQWGTLMCLAENDGLSGADMARIHHMTPQTMHTILHNLEHAGYIEREPHPQHGTILRVRLTPEGGEKLAEAKRRVETVHDRMVGALRPEEQDQLMDLLGRCNRALQDGTEVDPVLPCVE
jgi:DNA-binding MarR family transcriptional regulator